MPGERTPLLQQPHTSIGYDNESTDGPVEPLTVAEGLDQLSTIPIQSLNLGSVLSGRRSDSNSISQSQPEIPPIDYAFSLVLLLQLRHIRTTSRPVGTDLYSRWNHGEALQQDVKSLETLVDELWRDFKSRYRSEQDIDCVLWSSFHEDGTGAQRLKAVDYLTRPEPPLGLLTDSLIEAALHRRWKYGRSYSTPAALPLLKRLETAVATPWSLHFMAVASHFTYLILLASYLLYPPDRVTTQLGHYPRKPRLIALLVFLAANTLSSLAANRTLQAAAVLVFGLSLPKCPQPEDGYFEALLLIFGLHILFIHLPTVPTPALLFSPPNAVPLSVFIVRNIANILPSMTFFGPALLVSLVLLSYSLDGAYQGSSSNRIYTALRTFSASPMETRWAFLAIVVTLFLLWIISVFMASIIIPTLNGPGSESEASPSAWDRYGITPGRQARVTGALACSRFDGPYIFPSPLNLFEFAFVTPVELSARVLKLKRESIYRWRVWVWRIVVLPLLLPIYFISGLLC
ncbi:hypothetical protein CC1G_03685 [Coprinopsis cinerea okayama7|uniref:Uncharacterized protein n=1 Tax=Coprinopsis cinerea (strain Okayama-7 / 130 / ATCC MYA-4618 / FGSC 9003) TaxID=240176 RepID=A8N1Z2_COPC7|nr:hypothetical protein CC1G_03685 [Coprinopsis cinerea okayama7\|eukprot:XP_001828891.2 hypothetical protein CC1G_03685 [Coprinopsis cinerea okayama7\